MSLSTPLRHDRHFREQFKAALRAHLQAEQAQNFLAMARISNIHPALRPSPFPQPLVYTNDECLVILCGLTHWEREHVDQNYDPVNFTLPSAEYLESVFKPLQKHEIMKDFKPPKYEPPPPAVGHDLSVPSGTPEPTQFEPPNSKPSGNEPPSPTVYYHRSDSPSAEYLASTSSPAHGHEPMNISKQPEYESSLAMAVHEPADSLTNYEPSGHDSEYNPPSPSFPIYAELGDDCKVQCLGNIKPGESGYGDAKFLPDIPDDERIGTWLAGREAVASWERGRRLNQQAERYRRKQAQRRKKMKIFQIKKELLRMAEGESEIPVHLWEEFETREESNDPEEEPETASERASIPASEQWEEQKKSTRFKNKLMDLAKSIAPCPDSRDSPSSGEETSLLNLRIPLYTSPFGIPITGSPAAAYTLRTARGDPAIPGSPPPHRLSQEVCFPDPTDPDGDAPFDLHIIPPTPPEHVFPDPVSEGPENIQLPPGAQLVYDDGGVAQIKLDDGRVMPVLSRESMAAAAVAVFAPENEAGSSVGSSEHGSLMSRPWSRQSSSYPSFSAPKSDDGAEDSDDSQSRRKRVSDRVRKIRALLQSKHKRRTF